MRFPLILQMDFSATYCLIPGFVISFLIGHYQLRGRNRWGTIAVSLGKAPGQGTQHRLSDPKTETENPRVLLTRGLFLACHRGGQRSYPRSARKARRAFSRSRAASGFPQRITRALPPV